MAIDTANKRRNVMNIATPFLYLGLLPTLGVDTNDRVNLSEVYIGFEYSEPEIQLGRVRFIHGFGVGLGF